MRRESLEYLAIFVVALLVLGVVNSGVITAQNTINTIASINQTITNSTSSSTTTTSSTTTSLNTTSSTTTIAANTVTANALNTTSSTTTSSLSTTISNTTSSTTIPVGGIAANIVVGGPLPSGLSPNAFCAVIVNFSTTENESFTLNGTQFNVEEDAIGASDAKITVDGVIYKLDLNNARNLRSTANYIYFGLLNNIIYVPLANTVNLTQPYKLKPEIDLSICGSSIASRANSTSNSTVNVTSTTSTIAYNQTVVGNVTRMGFRNGMARASIRPIAGGANISVNGPVISRLNVRFRNGTAVSRFNISVANSLQANGHPLPSGKLAYQYVQINQSVYNTTNSVDPYITNVTYNFQVNSAWLAQQNTPTQNVTFFKYINSTSSWIQLPTALTGYNATTAYYDYSAVSNSFSLYAVGVTVSNTIPAVGNVVLALKGGFTTYFYAGATNTVFSPSAPTVTWTITSNTANTISGNTLYAATGYSTSNIVTFNAINANDVIAGIGANVVYSTGTVFTANTGAIRSNTLTLVFTTTTANSFVVVVAAASNTLLGSFTTNAPGNTLAATSNGLREWVRILVFNSLAAGSYNVVMKGNALGIASNSLIAMSAFVFPTFSVTFNDLPATGSIVTNGISQNSGNILSLVGTSSMNAIAPPGYTFSYWSVSNALNLSIRTPNVANLALANLTVEGNGVVTANYYPLLVATPNTPTLSNVIIDVGQISVVNTVISNDVGPYLGGWTLIPSNGLGNNPVNTIAAGTNPDAVAFNPSGSLAYVANFGPGTVNIISTASNTVVNTIVVGSHPDAIMLNPTGTLAYVLNAGSNTVNVISTGTNTIINTINVGLNPQGVAFNPQGSLAYVTNYGSASVNVISVVSNSVINTITVGANPRGVAFSPSGLFAYVTDYGSANVNVINVVSNTVVNTIITGTNPSGVAFSPTGNFVYVTNYGSATVNVISVASGKITNTITIGTNPYAVAFNPQGTLAYVTDYGSASVNVINTATNLVVNTIRVGTNPEGIAFSPSGLFAYVANNGISTVNVIYAPVTAMAALPTSSNALTLTFNAVSSNTISLTFNGVTQQFITVGTATLVGNWLLYGFGEDSMTGLAGITGLIGTNTVTVSNTLKINLAPTGVLTASNTILNASQSTTFNVLISGGQGPFTLNLIASNGVVVNTITGATQGTTTFPSIVPPVGFQSYNVVGTDTGTTTPFIFNILSASVTMALPASPKTPTVSNTIIDVGQSSTINTVISGGVGPYQGGWTLIPSNGLGNSPVNTILAGTNPDAIAFNPSGTLAYVANFGSGTVNVINTVSNTVGTTITVGSHPYAVMLNPAGTLLYVVNSGSGTVNVISTGSNTVISTITVGTNPDGVAFSPSGALAYVTNYGSASVNVISVVSNSVVNTITVGTNPRGVAFSPTGLFAYVTDYGSADMNVISVASNSIVNSIKVGTNPSGVAVNPSGSLAYVTNYGSATVNVINTATNLVVNTITIGTNPYAVAFNPQGTLAYVTLYGSASVNVINTATNLVVNTIHVGTNPEGIAFNPSGTFAYVANNGISTVNVIYAPATSMAALPTSSNALALTFSAVSSNTILLTFNGVTQQFVTAGTNTLPGNWLFYGFAEDSMTGLAGITGLTGTNTVTVYNTLQIYPQPTATLLTASNTILNYSQSTTFNVVITGGVGPFTLNLIASNGVVVNTITGATQGTTTFGSIVPPVGFQSYNVVGTDQGTTTKYIFNSSVSNLASSLLATPNPPTLSNSTIDVGQSTTINTVISKGVGPYQGEWTFVPSNWTTTKAPTALGVNPSYVAFNPAGTLAYVTNYGSNTVNVISTASNAVISTISVGKNPSAVAFNPLGTLAYVTNYGSNTVNVISVSSNSVINTIAVGTYPAGVVFNPLGTLAYVTNYGSNTVNVISVSSNTVVNTISVGNNPYGIIFNPQGTLLYVTGHSSGTVNVISVATNSIVNTIIVGSQPYESAINPQGTLMYVTNYGSGTVNVVNTATDKIVNTITVGTNPWDVAFNPAGTIAYVTNYGSNTVSILDILASLTENTVKVGTNPQGVAFSPSGTLAYVTNYGSASMNVLVPHETAVTPLSTSSNALTVTVNTISSNTMSLTFNGVMQVFTASGSGTLAGNWLFYGFGEDNTSVLAGQTGTNAVTVYNTLIIDPQPTANQLTASNVVLGVGQTTTFNVLISGGAGPFTLNLIASNGVVVNTITGATQGIATFGPITPPAGPQSYNVIGIDQGTTTPYTFNSVANVITGYGSACFISLSTNTINFGGINPNSNVPTANAIIDTNSGSVPAAFLIAGGVGDLNSWYDNSVWVDTTAVNTIGIANTLWSLTSQSGYAGTSLTNVLTTTGISIAAAGSNNIYLGMQIPGGTPTGAYTANIVIENSC